MYNNKRLLLVDDNRAFKFLARITLLEENINCAIEEAVNGVDALRIMEESKTPPDIILLDINMPLMGGYEFLVEYKKRNLHQLPTVIYILSTSILPSDKEKIEALGIASGFFEKPLEREHIMKMFSAIEVC